MNRVCTPGFEGTAEKECLQASVYAQPPPCPGPPKSVKTEIFAFDFRLQNATTLALSFPPPKTLRLISTHSTQPKDPPQVAAEPHCFVSGH